jgi:hypothetical protein
VAEGEEAPAEGEEEANEGVEYPAGGGEEPNEGVEGHKEGGEDAAVSELTTSVKERQAATAPTGTGAYSSWRFVTSTIKETDNAKN